MVRPVVERIEVSPIPEGPRTPEEIEELIARLERYRQIVARLQRGPTDTTRDLRELRSGASGDTPYPPGTDSTRILRDARGGWNDTDEGR